MEDKKQKWEVQFEEYKNGGLDKKLEEFEKKRNDLESQYKDKKIDGRSYGQKLTELKENQTKFKAAMPKIKANLPKVEHLVELREELNYLKNEIENELVLREKESKQVEDAKQIKDEMEKLDKENELLMPKIEDAKKRLKDQTLSDGDRKLLEEQVKNDEAKLKTNNERYMVLNEDNKNNANVERKDEISKMSKDDLKKNYQKICMKLSRNNFYAKRLLKGFDLENIKAEDKNIDWQARKYDVDVKKLMSKGKNANKIKQLKQDASEKQMQEQLAKDVQSIMKNKENAMVEVTEFDQKHPRLAKIKRLLSNVKNKIFNKNSNEKEEQQQQNDNSNNQKVNKHKDFVSSLKDMNKYEIFDVAEKGMDEVKKERKNATKKKLLENKAKSAEASKAKYEQGLNDYYKNHNINKTITDNTNYVDPSIKDGGR